MIFFSPFPQFAKLHIAQGREELRKWDGPEFLSVFLNPSKQTHRCHNVSLAEDKCTSFKAQETDYLLITSYTRESEAGVDPPPTIETVQSLKKSKSRKRCKETVQLLLFFHTLTARCC